MFYAKVGSGFQNQEPFEGAIQMQGERPTSQHVAQADGTWVLPATPQEEHEQIDVAMLDMAETIVALNDRITKLEGGTKA